MSNNTTTTKSTGLTFVTALQLLFIGLKLAHVIDWSWVWVLAPTWIDVSLAVLICVIAGVIVAFKGN